MEKLAEDLFHASCTIREHAIFELGIKLAALYHILIGAPIKNDPEILKSIGDGIKKSIECQPFVNRVDVSINLKKEGMSHEYIKKHQFDYTYISPKNLEAEVEVQYGNWIAIGDVKWQSDLSYPLMRVKEIYKKEE